MRPASIFSQILALGVLIGAVALGAGVILTLALPAPDRGKMNTLEMVWALENKPSSVIDVHRHREPPEGLRNPLAEAALAAALRRPAAEIRAVWMDQSGATDNRGENIVRIDGRDILVSRDEAGFRLEYGPDARLSEDTFVPLFIGAVQTSEGAWLVGVPHDPVREAWRSRLLIAFTLAGLLLTPLIWIVVRQISRPVEALAKSAEAARLGSNDPFAVDGPREVRVAAQAVNAMHARLAAQASEQVRMMAALAHDLRTPITAIRLRLARAPIDLRTRLEPDLVRMSALIDDSLGLAQVGLMTSDSFRADLQNFVISVQRDRISRGEAVRLGEVPPAWGWTDLVLLRRALDNLIDNALRYGESATLSIRRTGECAIITVEDQGPGIPEAEIARLLRPFEVMDPARSRTLGGTGLGLSIVADIAARLGHELRIGNGERGLVASLVIANERERVVAGSKE